MTESLRSVRLRLTAWYAGTSVLILVLLGGALLWVMSRQVALELDRTLHEAVGAAVDAAELRARTGEAPGRAAVDAVRAIATPGRFLYLFDSGGLSLVPEADVHPAIAAAAIEAFRDGTVTEAFDLEDASWRLFGQRFRLRGRVFVVIALADASVDRRQFSRIIEAFMVAGLIAVLLAAVGGWVVSGITAAPVERAFAERQRFMAEAAHELRTPLAVLRGHADLALERSRGEAAADPSLRVIAAEADRMGRIVDDLFTLARADAGERSVRRERVFLDDAASDAVTAARPLADGRGVRLDLGRYEEAPLTGDPDRIRQLIAILIDNAVKYTPAGGSVRVDAFRDGASGGARLVVEDTGEGIAAEDLPHIFDRFHRGAATRGTVPGAGLGLAIARWITDSHGATLRVDSEAGRGTRVTVEFAAPGATA